MKAITSICLVLVGLIHLLPVIGVTGAERLHALYGVALTEPNQLILMRHRAVLFGLLGAFTLWAAFDRALQPAAFVLAAVSMLSFIWVARTTGSYNAELTRVVVVDLIASGILVVGGVACLLARRSR